MLGNQAGRLRLVVRFAVPVEMQVLREFLFRLSREAHRRPFERGAMHVLATQVVEHLRADLEVRAGSVAHLPEVPALFPSRHDELPLQLREFARLHRMPFGHAGVLERRENGRHVEHVVMLQAVQEVQGLPDVVIGLVRQTDDERIDREPVVVVQDVRALHDDLLPIANVERKGLARHCQGRQARRTGLDPDQRREKPPVRVRGVPVLEGALAEQDPGQVPDQSGIDHRRSDRGVRQG